jgi:hypothetical protein
MIENSQIDELNKHIKDKTGQDDQDDDVHRHDLTGVLGTHTQPP